MAFSVTIPSHVVHENIDGEVIILNLRDGLYHTLNDPAGYLWAQIADENDLESIVADVSTTFGLDAAPARAVVAELLRAIRDENLVEASGLWPQWAAIGMDADLEDILPAFRPVIETYRDMRAALVLDPIHDVDEKTGWPSPKQTEDEARG